MSDNYERDADGARIPGECNVCGEECVHCPNDIAHLEGAEEEEENDDSHS